ncbi:replication initiation protein [Rummeliibacillus pycnus]|uniref:replication initiation protein n=1 Tax=Rummeliibacillus pycnus TaxID=101070 RepID=UPI003D2BC794
MDNKYENFLVTKSHDLIEARQKKPLTLREQKLILMLVSTMQPTDEDFKEYQITIEEYCDLMQIDKRSSYHPIKKTIHEIVGKTVEIPLEEGRYLVTNWLSSVEYIEGEAIMNISFQPKLKPYLLQLKKFTSYRLKYVLSLHSVYAIRLYELVKKWQVTSIEETQKIIELEELRGKMGAIAKSYKRYSQLKQLLNDVIFELNEKTDVFISFEEIKKGRSVKSLRFKIRENLNTKEVQSIETRDTESSVDNLSELEKDFMKMEEMRLRINEKAEGYDFDGITFFGFYNELISIFDKDIETELMYLIKYINEPESNIENPIGFIKFKVKELLKLHQSGGKGSFKSLLKPKNYQKNTRKKTENTQQNLPDWFIEAQKKKELAKAQAETAATSAESSYNAKMEEVMKKWDKED